MIGRYLVHLQPLSRVGIPACAIDEFRRIVWWNDCADTVLEGPFHPERARSHNGRRPIPIESRSRQTEDARVILDLTVRERELLSCIVQGLDARRISRQLGITHATARNYTQRLLAKLGARNKTDAVRLAYTYNLLAS